MGMNIFVVISRKSAYIIPIIFLVSIISLSMSSPARPAEDELKRDVVTKEVVGAVGGISRNFIAVDYAVDQGATSELAVSIPKDVKTLHKKLSDIQAGDIVAVTYEEVFEHKKGEESRQVSRRAKVIDFRSRPQPPPESGGLMSQEEQ